MLFQITDYNGKYHINSVLHIFFYIQLDLAIKMILAKLALLLNAHESFFCCNLTTNIFDCYVTGWAFFTRIMLHDLG